jgi:predicted ATPase/DNA-binding CsgD family transcriptional regulator/transcriptional regulator with XRE-family HTH domain
MTGTTLPSGFGALLRRHRLGRGLTQEALAERAGLSARGLSDLERGSRHVPHAHTIERLTEALELTPGERVELTSAGRREPAPRTCQIPSSWAGLPHSGSPLIGRQRELASVRGLVAHRDTRVVTLTGPGGVGKTRLALAVAAETPPKTFADGVVFVDLSAVHDPDAVMTSIARLVGVHPEASCLLASLAQVLADKRLLLVVDNFEQVLAAAPAVDALLEACGGLTVLATSREPLRLRRERVVSVPPLGLPDLDGEPALELLADTPAVALFAHRAAETRAGFRLTADNVRAVAELCVRLDGLPLAIELAAARTRALPPASILARMEQRLDLLASGALAEPARHQTLRTAFAWSYNLISAEEQAVFRRLATFAGGCTLDAAEAVCSDQSISHADVLGLLAELIDKSLIVLQEGHDLQARYRFLETLRQYAAEELRAMGEDTETRQRHLDWYLALAEQAEPELRSAHQATWLDRLELEYENIRAALAWALESGANLEAGLRLASALRWFWHARGHPSEGRQWLERGLTAQGLAIDAVRAKALDVSAALAHSQSDYAVARSLQEQGLVLWRQECYQPGVAAALNTLGIVAKSQGDYLRAGTLMEEALGIARELGDRPSLAQTLNNLATVAIEQGDYEGASARLEESLAIRRALGDGLGVGSSLHNLGECALQQGAHALAAACFEESLDLFRQLRAQHRVAQSLQSLGIVALRRGEVARAATQFAEALSLMRQQGDNWGVVVSLEGLAEAAVVAREGELSLRLFGAVAAWREENNAPLPESERAHCDRALAVARESLNEEAIAAAVGRGRVMPFEKAIACALTFTTRVQSVPLVRRTDATPAPELARLTYRERDVAALIARGLTNRQIAEQLVITEATTERHVTNILKKLGVASRVQVATWAMQMGALA